MHLKRPAGEPLTPAPPRQQTIMGKISRRQWQRELRWVEVRRCKMVVMQWAAGLGIRKWGLSLGRWGVRGCSREDRDSRRIKLGILIGGSSLVEMGGELASVGWNVA
jgi:hypothetical protein